MSVLSVISSGASPRAPHGARGDMTEHRASLDIGPGDEVLCPSFTFFATAGSVSRTGATPVFVDSLDDDFNLDLEDAARRVTDKTKAIIPVHLFGQAADMDAGEEVEMEPVEEVGGIAERF